MRRRLQSLVVLLLLLAVACNELLDEPRPLPPSPTASPTPSASPTPERERYVVDAQSCLRLRAEPSLRAAVVACLPPGTEVEGLGRMETADGYRWLRVRSAQRRGWVAEEFLKPAGISSPEPEGSPSG